MNLSTVMTATAEAGGMATIISTILPFALLILVMYFLIIRPQVGDIIVTIGGIEGIVVNIKEDTLLLESGDNRNKIRVKRWAVQTNETVHEEAETAKKKKGPVQ